MSTPKLVPFPIKKRQQNGQRLVPVKMSRNRGIRRRINIPLIKYTNNTNKEINPKNNLNWADIDEFFNDIITTSSDNSNNEEINNNNWPKKGFNRRELGIKKLKKDGEINIKNNIKFEEEEELNNKLINKEKELITSSGGGGSFAMETFENKNIKQQNGVSLLQMPFQKEEIIETSPLIKSPKFNVVPLINPINRKEGWVHINGNNNENNNNKIDNNFKLNGLLECCQEQSIGCRPLCSRNVSKEQIKQAMSSGRCPPLSLTNVIQCFPHYYNITSVGQCCSSSIILNNNIPNLNNIFQRKYQIPSQCLNLCSSNFQLTFAHLVCIEYVEHILGCYRQLLEKEENNNEWKESQIINNELTNFQHK